MTHAKITLAVVILLVAFLFIGCATQVAAPADPIVAHHDTTIVEKPVPVPCLAESDVPSLPTPTALDADNSTIRQKAAALLLDLMAYRQYADVAYSLLKKCSSLP